MGRRVTKTATGRRSRNAELAEIANREHARVEESTRGALPHARLAGDALLLIKTRQRLKNERWFVWLETNFKGTAEVARHYMDISQAWPNALAKFRDDPNLGIKEALKIIHDEASREQLRKLRKHVTELAAWILSEWTDAVNKTIESLDRGDEIGKRFGKTLTREFEKIEKANSPISEIYGTPLEVELLQLTWGIKPDWMNRLEAADPNYDYYSHCRCDD